MLDWILLIARWIAGLFLLLVAVTAFVFTVRKKAPAKGWEGLAVAAFAGSLAAWLLTLQTVCLWGLLAGFISFLVRELSGKKPADAAPVPPSSTPVNRPGFDRPPRQITAAERRVMEVRRGVPFTEEELTARAKFDADIQFGLAVWEGERGRILREDTLPEAVAYLKRLQADSKIQEAEEDRLEAEKDAADEAAREAAAREMSTPPAAARQCRLVLKKQCRITGDSGESLLLPPGPVDFHLSFVMEPGADAEGVPLLRATVWTDPSNKVTRCLNLVEIIDFENLKSAEWWRAQPADRQQSFLSGIVLPAAECCEYTRGWRSLRIGGEKTRFYCSDTPFKAVLSVPDGSDSLWCRIHGIEWFDPGDEDISADEIKIPPFLFPLNTERFLRLRHIPEGEDSSLVDE